MEVEVSVAGWCGKFVWGGRPRPRTACSKTVCRASTDFVCDLGRMQAHIGCHHSVHLNVEKLSPLQDMAAPSSFVAHADFSQHSCRRGVVHEMASENPMQSKHLEPIVHHGRGCLRGIAFPQ